MGMAKEEALKILKYRSGWNLSIRDVTALNMAIEALKQEPEDAISRQDTLKTIIKHLGIRSEEYLLPAEEAIYKVVKNMPSVTPQQKAGHWIIPKGDVKPFGDDTIQCDMCGFFTDVDCNYNFCPNCGVKMIEPQESEVQDADSN